MTYKLTYAHHDLLGYIPRPHHADAGTHIDADGQRLTGEAAEAAGPPILAVGDSFTFGDEVG
ncbi:MAG: hypothetical protein FJX11_20380, partial [Alphaproteobacteria bacterium]|nr:hypothetical protein [Alphaproteobacteria bacterium]